MKRVVFGALAVGLSASLLSGVSPAAASGVVDKGEYLEDQSYGLSYDFESPDGVEVKFLSPQGEVIADVSEYVNDEITIDRNGDVSVQKEDVSDLPVKGEEEDATLPSAETQAASCSASKTIPSKYGVVKAKACKSGSKVKASGSYKDTKSDGWCLGARVKWKPSGSTWSSGYSSRACPKGNSKSFATSYRKGKSVDVYGIGYKAKN